MKTPREGVPTKWTDYVVVDDIEATLTQCVKLGGKVCMGPMDIPDVGRIAVIQDPQGAGIGLHQCV
jgi:predicted enzyme related to lactoylglutathione lyase